MTRLIYEDAISMTGGTPLRRLIMPQMPRLRLHLKMEGRNPTGSVKDRAGLYMIQQAIARGDLVRGMTIIDSSSGNMACSLAFFGRLHGFDSKFAVSSKLTEDKRSFLRFFRAELHQAGDFTIEGTKWCRRFMEQADPEKWFFTDQLHNWDNPQAHYESTGPEILAALPNVQMVVASLGSGGTLYGTGSFLKEHRDDVVVVAVESASGTKIPGTGTFVDGDYETPFIRKGKQDGLFDERHQVAEEDAVRRILELRDMGVFVGLQTGAVVHAALIAAERHDIAGDVVAISGDAGWKNFERLVPIADEEGHPR